MTSARSFFGYSQEEQEAALDAERERHQEAILNDLFKSHPDKLAQLRERPWQAGWFVGQLIIKMGREADTMGAWGDVLRRAFAKPTPGSYRHMFPDDEDEDPASTGERDSQ